MRPKEPIVVSDEDTEELETEAGEGTDLDDEEVEELADGSAIVKPKAKPKKKKSTFGANIAETLEESELSLLGIELCERVESDRNSRAERDKQYEEGIRRTGVGGDAPGGAEFDGASKVVHPMLAKACVDFASKAIKELYPASGPCKTQIIGETTDAKLSKAERKKTYVNWQLTTQVSENRAEFERLLSQIPLGGSQYKRWWYDSKMRRLRTEAVFIDDVFLPYNSHDFYTSHRVTHRQYINKQTFEARVAAGLYRDINIPAPPTHIADKSAAREASEKVEGVEEDTGAYNDEGLREIYMIYADLDLEEEGEVVPYIVHIEAYSHRVLGIYRNWAEEDEQQAKKHWMVEYTFIPWRGPHGLGLAHLIGSMAAAATGSLRGLLDSAHIQNFPGGLKLKGGRNAGQSITVNATELAEIEAPPGVDDIRKLVMPFPFAGPSAVLMQLLEWLTGQAETVVATASEKIADAGANMPMGTALALIEQGSVNFSAIHSRMHASLKRELEMVQRLNAEYMNDKETVEDLGELVVTRQDFIGPTDIIPVSDPNIFSEAQRYAQMQAVLQLSADPRFTPMFPPDKLLRRVLKLLQVSDVDDITRLPKEPQRLDPTEENFASAAPEPTPLKVYEEQDDVSHLICHTHFMTSPMFGSNQLIGPQSMPALLAHCKDHLMAVYRKHSKAASRALMTVARMRTMPLTQEQAEAHGAAFADQIMAQALAPVVMPALQAAMQAMGQFAPKPQADPNTQAVEAGKVQIEQMRLQGNQQLKTMELQAADKRDAQDRQANEQAAALASQQESEATHAKVMLAAMQEEGKRQAMMLQAHIDAVMEAQKTAREHEAAARAGELGVLVQMLKDQGGQQLVLLQAMLGSVTSAPTTAKEEGGEGGEGSAPAAPPKLQIAGTQEVIAGIMQSMADNNRLLMQELGAASGATQAVLGKLAESMQALHAAQTAPRSAEIIRDERGKPKGLRMIPGGIQ